MFERITKLILPHREIIMDGDAGLSRRSFIKGVGAVTASGIILASPSVVQAVNLMNVRGEPLRLVDFIPCDGRMLRDDVDKDLSAVIGQTVNGLRDVDIDGSARDYGPMRRYGGSPEEGTFAVPDFRPFEAMDFIPGARFEIDRSGQLYVSTDVKSDKNGDLALQFGRDGAADLLAGRRVKL